MTPTQLFLPSQARVSKAVPLLVPSLRSGVWAWPCVKVCSLHSITEPLATPCWESGRDGRKRERQTSSETEPCLTLKSSSFIFICLSALLFSDPDQHKLMEMQTGVRMSKTNLKKRGTNWTQNKIE